jgi:hypothetical protein
VTDSLIAILGRSQKTLTLAPERGNEAERYRLGKRISDSVILETVERAALAGIQQLKLYFVCGLVAGEFYSDDVKNNPESNEKKKLPAKEVIQHESESIAGFVSKLAKCFRDINRAGTLSVTCSPFIPKPHTPWAGWPMMSEADLRKLDQTLVHQLGKIPGVRTHSFGTTDVLVQGILSQGSGQITKEIIELALDPSSQKKILRRLIATTSQSLHTYRWESDSAPWSQIIL